MAGKPGMHKNRQASGVTQEEAITQGLQTGDPRDPNQGKRAKRIPMSAGMNLEVYESGLDDGEFYFHWIAEQPSRGGRLEKAKQAGYEHVTGSDGTPVSRRTGPGIMYLMKLPMEYRLEDEARKRAISEAKMDEQNRIGRNEYAPTAKGRAEGGDTAIVDRHTTDNPYAA